MYLVYTPDGGERQEWWFDAQKVRAQEAEAIEKRTGWDWAEFGRHLFQGSVLARRALLWMFQRRAHPTLRFEDVDFATSELELEMSRGELLLMRDGLASVEGGASPAALAAMEREIEQAREGPGKAPASGDA